MIGHGSKLGRKREEAIAALITCPSVEKAAQAIDVNAKTLRTWMQMPEFEEAYRQARRDHAAQLSAQFQQECPLALGTLLAVMVDQKARHASRIRAAICTVQFAVQAGALEELQARVRRLEQQQSERPNSASPRPLPVETPNGASRRGHGAKFARKKEEAIAALVMQPTREAAAQVAGVSAKTLQRWLEIAEFREAYRKAQWDKFSQLTAQFQHVCAAARMTLRNVMIDKNAPVTSKISAAVFTLNFAANAWTEDLQLRAQALEPRPQETRREGSQVDSPKAA